MEDKTMCAPHAETPRPTRTRPRGQSLLEFSLSAALMILLISGIVDLGRAYFALIALDSVISEGAHWAAAYPGCVPTASDTLAGPPECQGTNSIVGRMLNENSNLDLSKMVSVSVTPENVSDWMAHWVDGVPTRGQTVLFSVAYRVDAIMPVTQLITGSTMTITAQAKEVVRGVGLPEYVGAPTAQGGVEFVPTPAPPTGLRQQSTGLGVVCTAGNATLLWDLQVASGYRVYEEDGTTLVVEVTPGTTTSANVYVGVGASKVFKVSAFNNNGLHEAESDKVSITVTCNDVRPTNLTMSCVPGGATASWTPSPSDSAVTGYALIRLSPATIKTVFSGALTGSGSFAFNSPDDSPADYKIQARAADGTLLGVPTNIVSLSCTVPPGLPDPVQNFRRASPAVCNNGQATLMWDPSFDASGYEVFEGSTLVADITSNITTSTVVNVGSGTGSHDFYIRAYVDDGSGKLYGAFSGPLSVSCPTLRGPSLQAPTCEGLGAGGYTMATFRWTPFSGDTVAAGYQLRRQDGALRSPALMPLATNAYQVIFQPGDNPANYRLYLVDVSGNPIGTPSALRYLNCPLPPPIQEFAYTPGSCIRVSGSANAYMWQWRDYSWPESLTFRITHAPSGTNYTPTGTFHFGGFTFGWITVPKQREGDSFSVTAIQASTGMTITGSTSMPTILPIIGNACR